MLGVIMAAGYGSRFFPVTKSIPKEMFPIINKPVIDFVLDEFAQAEIHDVVLILSRKKNALLEYVEKDFELSHFFNSKNKKSFVSNSLRERHPKMNWCVVFQERMLGTGEALLLAESFIGKQTFILAYPDDIFIGSNSPSLQLKQCMDIHSLSTLGVIELSKTPPKRYGIVSIQKAFENNMANVLEIQEKPEKPKTNIISLGRYALTSDIFRTLRNLRTNHSEDSELHLTEALHTLAHQNKLMAKKIHAQYLDVGDPINYLKSITEYALSHVQFKDEYVDFLKQKLQCLTSLNTVHPEEIPLLQGINTKSPGST